MARFRKRPLEVDAWQFDGTAECAETITRTDPSLSFSMLPEPVGVIIEVETLEGTMEGHKGDWVIRGIMGEFYICRGDIFAATYDLVEELSPMPQPDHTLPYHRV